MTSATNNGERGTPKYSAPEVASWIPSGRAADIFSLGCIDNNCLLLVGTRIAMCSNSWILGNAKYSIFPPIFLPNPELLTQPRISPLYRRRTSYST
ncbi:hypothetical protein BCR34DRAFT_580744 [Clohesyomyces aquaticus]|uniref:Protein kinase domain-containing protein n=1 Tax=Clohesyomyces aquaticus TaxID=1231657 RepID=A0A1Y1Y4X7_9PLEO|nr:hypothetical protein BCR34DRAFT_580744 [Clohesyomyces aquaticus]